METVNNIDKRTHFFREIYLSHFILERVDVSCVWEVSWRWEQTATYWPQVPLYYSSTSSSFYWAAQPGSWGSKASVWCWLSLQHLVTVTATRTELCLPRTPTELKPFVAPGYIIVWHPPASCGHLHRIQPYPQVKVIPRYLRPDAPVIYTGGNLLSFLLRCGTRPYEGGTQWDSNSLV